MYNPDQTELSYQERDSERDRYAGLAKIALPRFPEKQRGESIGAEEIRNRLKMIRDAGYSVGQGIYRLKKTQLWGKLQAARTDIRTKANEYCPEVVREIDSQNRQKEAVGRDLLMR